MYALPFFCFLWKSFFLPSFFLYGLFSSSHLHLHYLSHLSCPCTSSCICLSLAWGIDVLDDQVLLNYSNPISEISFFLLQVKNFFLPSNLTPFLLSFLSILVVLLTIRARLASSISSSLELSYSILALPFSWLALNAKSFSWWKKSYLVV